MMCRRCGRAGNTLIEGVGLHPSDIPTPAALIDERACCAISRACSSAWMRSASACVRTSRPRSPSRSRAAAGRRRQRNHCVHAEGSLSSSSRRVSPTFLRGVHPAGEARSGAGPASPGLRADHPGGLDAGGIRGRRQGPGERHPFDVMIEVDSDGHRSGVKADDPKLIEIASCCMTAARRSKGS